ncbi:MAG: hypothetical protein A3J76_04245 [Candidatus Moranbacteria bacterium RBG_13_45_13]|nr:MAG: hypothetical protein A3J76_04245 [Candidatus Moranbacteria bacterium RBG_13_45_13]
MSEIFSQLFDSRSRARLIKFFMLNDKELYSLKEISKKNQLSSQQVIRELPRFERMKMIVSRSKKGQRFFQTNRGFIFYPELKNLVIKSNTLPECRSLHKIKDLGRVKLALMSGVFLNHPKGRADLLIVGDELSRAKLKHLLESLEAEVGKEINYSIMNSEEFKYRTDMLDKFVMEFLESPYEEIICRIPNLKEIANRRK